MAEGRPTRLILVKHASPEKVPHAPSHEWPLSEAGRASCATLAVRLGRLGIGGIVTSTEPKAVQTGHLVGEALGVAVTSAPDLHEHDRSNVPLMRTGDYISAMSQFFREPRARVLGRESAEQVERRFLAAVDAVVAAHAGNGTLAVVTHGTVIALYAAARLGLNAFGTWRRMGLPSFIDIDGERVEVVEKV